MSKSKYKKAVESLDKRIAEHKEKQRIAKSPEFFHYWEKEIQKFEKEKKEKAKMAVKKNCLSLPNLLVE